LETLTYPDNSFDIVITQDVLEHVRHHESALREIHRVLRPNGHHIFTIPFSFHQKTISRIDTSGPNDVPLLPAEYHGDRIRGAIITYRNLGIDLFGLLEEIGFSTTVAFSTKQDHRFGIFDSYVFSSRKQ
jgi:predicted SAM-dependent methyltransferase